MNKNDYLEIYENTNYVRIGGSEDELRCANYFKDYLASKGIEAHIEDFDTQASTILDAKLVVDGKEIKAVAYKNSGSHDVSGEIYYLRRSTKRDFKCVKNKIVLIDTYFGRYTYRDLVENGAKGIITFSSSRIGLQNDDIDPRELRAMVKEGLPVIPVFNIHLRDGMAITKAKNASLYIKQEEGISKSYNVVSTIEGQYEDTLVFCAHYDSVPLSKGAYDNMSGTIAVLDLLTRYTNIKPKYTLKFILCGSEERGLLGSKAYCETHKDELDKYRLVFNVDMIGTLLGYRQICCTSDMDLVHYLDYHSEINGYDTKVYQGVYSSDSTPFADKGIPSITFATIDRDEMNIIHNRYDDLSNMDMDNLKEDIDVMYEITKVFVDSKVFPVKRHMPDNMKEELDIYNLRKEK